MSSILKQIAIIFILQVGLASCAFPRQDDLSVIKGRGFPEPCKMVNKLLSASAQGTDLTPKTVTTTIPARLAYRCALSAPLIKNNTLRMLDAVDAMLDWQSTLNVLKSPPPGYLMDATNLNVELQELRGAVLAGHIVSEYALQETVFNIIHTAHDGHLFLALDVMNVFGWYRPWADFVSLSSDGLDIPEIYVYDDIIKQKDNGSFTPSPVELIDGRQAEDWLLHEALDRASALQDPDAMYNDLFNTPGSEGQISAPKYYPGPSTTISFKNGTSQVYVNQAFLLRNFTGVVDGRTFYDTFVEKKIESTKGDVSNEPVDRASLPASNNGLFVNDLSNVYPEAAQEAHDGTVAGYFLKMPQQPVVAILKIASFSPASREEFQTVLIQFLEDCATNDAKFLVIDMQSNGGGDIGLGYEAFKRLFPTIVPRAPANFASHDQLNILGSYFTRIAWEAWSETGNISTYEAAGGYSIFDARASISETGRRYESWEDLSGPVSAYGSNFTKLVLPPLEDVQYQRYMSGIIFNNATTQPFEAQNIVVLGDGHCASTCDTFLNQLKWKAGVKTIVAGGRPITGPVQYVGGVKGRRKLGLNYLNEMLRIFKDTAPEDLQLQANRTKLKILIEDGEYLDLRSQMSVNMGNAILDSDHTFTPLQFVYEAADCKIWWQAEHLFDITTLWALVAETAFGLNSGQKWTACVQGSTGHPSSATGGNLVDLPPLNSPKSHTVQPETQPGPVTKDSGQTQNAREGSRDPSSAARNKISTSWLISIAIMVCGIYTYLA